MTEVSYNPIATLVALDTDNLLDTAAAFLGCSRYDIAVINQIVTEHGKTRRGAALARAYLEGRE